MVEIHKHEGTDMKIVYYPSRWWALTKSWLPPSYTAYQDGLMARGATPSEAIERLARLLHEHGILPKDVVSCETD